MYWTDIHEWSKKKLIGYTIAFYVLYSLFLVIAPCIVIAIKYGLFKNAPTETETRVNGTWLIVIFLLCFGLFLVVKRLINKIPDCNINWRRFKFGLDATFSMIPFISILIVMSAVKDNLDLAYSTLQISMWFMIASCVVDGVWVKFIDWEWSTRAKAEMQQEINKRIK